MLHQHSQTIPTILRDFPEWRRGRREFALWLIELEHDEVHRKLAAARRHLSGLLLDQYQRQPHLTLFVAGFPALERRFDDDYPIRQFETHCRVLNDADLAAFTIEIHQLNSFASAPFFEVHDTDHGIEKARHLLSGTWTEVERDRYLPHVTVGLYAGAFESLAVLERIETFTDEPVSVLISRITFAGYDAAEMGGPMAYKHHVKLRT